MHPRDLRVVCNQASTLMTYPEIRARLVDQLEPQYVDLALKMCVNLVAPRICELTSVDERRAAIMTWPKDDGGLRGELQMMVSRLWRRNKKKPPGGGLVSKV